MSITKNSYAATLRDTLSALSIKKKCCLHAFRDGQNLYSENAENPADRANTIGKYTTRAKCDVCISHFVRGIFLCRGSVTDPHKAHHLEFSFQTAEERDALADLLTEQGFEGKKGERKNHFILYWKARETIADFIAYLGANAMAFEYMNSCIERDFNSTVNREVNCDTANIGKALTAAEKQLTAIRKLQKQKGLDTLPPALRETAVLRLENDTLPLSQLGELHNPPISKSCVNHRLMRLEALAEEDTSPGSR